MLLLLLLPLLSPSYGDASCPKILQDSGLVTEVILLPFLLLLLFIFLLLLLPPTLGVPWDSGPRRSLPNFGEHQEQLLTCSYFWCSLFSRFYFHMLPLIFLIFILNCSQRKSSGTSSNLRLERKTGSRWSTSTLARFIKNLRWTNSYYFQPDLILSSAPVMNLKNPFSTPTMEAVDQVTVIHLFQFVFILYL